MTITKAVCEAQASADGSALTINLYGRIGSSFWDGGITPQMVQDKLDAAPHARAVQVNISSPGGSAVDGQAIRSILSAHPATVTLDVVGLAASAASIIAMGADKIRMHTGSSMMIHGASTITQGGVDDHDKAIAALNAANTNMADLYAARSGKSAEKCAKLMAAETWYTADQAVKEGFADEVIKGKSGTPQASIGKGPDVRFDVRGLGYSSVPVEYAHFFITAQDREVSALSPEPLKELTGESNEMADYTRIAQILGLSADVAEGAVLSALDKVNKQLAASEKHVGQLLALTGTTEAAAAFGVLQAFAEAAKQLPVLKAQTEQQAKALEDAERAALFAADAADPKGRKIVPATQAYWTEQPLSALKNYLAVAPVVVVTQPTTQQPAVATGSTPTNVSALKHNGKTWEEMEPMEKHNLHASDRAAFDALKQNHVDRGSPRPAKPKSPERASA